MTPSPIAKVLSSIRKHNVRALLMGGQACILYGAAEFSRDIDLAVLAEEKNLDRLGRALTDLHEEDRLRRSDREYWQPLREELFKMRQAQRQR